MSKAIKTKLTFDPQKNYRWEPSDTFKLTGQQFASLYHLLSQEMNTPGGAPLALKVEAHGVIMSIFAQGVASGEITEADPAEVSRVEESKVKSMFK